MLEKVYNPGPVEAKWVSAWRRARLFHAEPSAEARPFVVVIPPPNVTGALHIGHALNNALQDLMVRWRRLNGDAVCWVPGTDHGGIATQNVMEKQLRAEKGSRQALGREKFLERMREWTLACKSTILGQLERLGCALDWDREAFTMDEPRARAVLAAFKHLWEKGLIYRGERMVNWCVRCGTALSDIEVEYEERKGKLWHIHYPSADGGRGLVVATTRPETMLGDTAVAVNPKDSRYAALVGKTLKLPLTGRTIPVKADEHVDPSFGTGAVKVTPAHDPNDFEIGQRHSLPSIKVIGPDGKMTADAGEGYSGLSREQARDKVAADLRDGGFLEKTEEHPHAVGVCYRCNQAIEPLVSWQWFVKMPKLAEPAVRALDRGDFRLFPESWRNPYRRWLQEIRDWCISRQIWWGHRIPVWYCVSCNPGISEKDFHQAADLKGIPGAEKPQRCPDCGGTSLLQDPDVLDTWFSSALWPFSVFGWPEKTKDLEYFYPTSALVTGYEILYLWVARMQMMGLELMGGVPFSTGIIHGIVRDKAGKKMSKSLGNVVDPLVMMDKYGTDAFRFSLLSQAHPGRDIPFAEDSITGPRNFANKLWNSTRFVLMNLPAAPPAGGYRLESLSHCCLELADRWVLAQYQGMLARVRENMDAHEFAAAADTLYGFLWDSFCDWYVELAKIRLTGIDGEEKEAARAILVEVLVGTLKMLHPFMPFITEELYASLKAFAGQSHDFLIQSGGPVLERDWQDGENVSRMEAVMEAVVALRTLRSQLNVPPGLKIQAHFEGPKDRGGLVLEHAPYLKYLARLESLSEAEGAKPARSATALAAGLTFYVPLEGLIDFDKERARLEKEAREIDAQLARCKNQLSNEAFVSRAPQAEVETIRRRQADFEQKQSRLREILSSLN